jgi:WS/DGAT/MGAT family acyltransferase
MDWFADPLSTLDTLCLAAERPGVPLHIGATLVLDGGPLVTRAGVVDRAAFAAHVASRLDRIPRYRQRLVESALAGRSFWVDDDRFDLAAHVRFERAPGHGRERDLKDVAGEIFSRPLDRGRPLWELTVVDRLEGGRFAVVSKVHHCLADGLGGVSSLCALLDTTADASPRESAEWKPRQAPGMLELVGEDVATGVRGVAAAFAVARDSVLDPIRTLREVTRGTRSLAETARALVRPARPTKLNRPLGGKRRFQWLGMSLSDVRRVERHLAVTTNDVVLATVAGALHRHFGRSRSDHGTEVRAAVPTSMRTEETTTGNQPSPWLVPLPVDERDPLKRLEAVRVATAEGGDADSARRLRALLWLTEGLVPAVGRAGVTLFERLLPFNVIVTGAPGPQVPLFLNGARLTSVYPAVPLFRNQGLAIALFSYAGTLYWGFLADPSVAGDLDELVYSVAVSFCQLLDRVETAGATAAA